MKKYQEKLSIVDKNDNVIGEDTRENIHKKGLLHREIRVWVYNNNLDILFQRRSSNKDTFPNKLDASVGGHVDLGLGYEETAIKELKEETGIDANKKDLIFLGKMRSKSYDPKTETTNKVIRAVFAYKFDGDIKDLKIEKGKATSLEFWPMERLFHLTEKEKLEFVPFSWKEKIFPFFREIKKLNEK